MDVRLSALVTRSIAVAVGVGAVILAACTEDPTQPIGGPARASVNGKTLFVNVQHARGTLRNDLLIAITKDKP